MAEVWIAEVAKRVSWVREKVQVPKPNSNWAHHHHHHQVVVEDQEEPSLLINSSPTISSVVAVGSTATNKQQAHEATTLSDATLCMLIDRFTPC